MTGSIFKVISILKRFKKYIKMTFSIVLTKLCLSLNLGSFPHQCIFTIAVSNNILIYIFRHQRIVKKTKLMDSDPLLIHSSKRLKHSFKQELPYLKSLLSIVRKIIA
jgi:hypothetical protein